MTEFTTLIAPPDNVSTEVVFNTSVYPITGGQVTVPSWLAPALLASGWYFIGALGHTGATGPTGATGAGTGGTGGATGPTGAIQFTDGAGAFLGEAALIWDKTAASGIYLNIAEGNAAPSSTLAELEADVADVNNAFMVGLSVLASSQRSGATNNLLSLIGINGGADSQLPSGKTVGTVIGFEGQAINIRAGMITNAYGVYGNAYNVTTGSITNAYGVYSLVENDSTGTIGAGYGFYADFLQFGLPATITTAVGYYAKAMNGGIATNEYSFWSDEQGVFRIKADNSFNSVYQAIPALYNPQFAHYVPGAASFERFVFGRWNSNVAELTPEAGGTGTLRGMRIAATDSVPLAFHSASPVARQTVTGSRGGNVALADLLTKLAAKGLIVDGTSP